MLKQGIKMINAEFFRIHLLFQFSFVQFRPYAISFQGLLLCLTLMTKSKKALETSLDLTPLFKTSFDTRLEGFVSNVDYLENQHLNLFKRDMAETDVCHAHKFFLYGLFTTFMTPKGKK